MTNEEMFERLLNEVRGIKGDINELKHDVSGIKNDVSGIKGEIKSIKLRIDNIDERLGDVEVQTKENTNKLDEVIKFNQTTALDTVEYIHNKLATKDSIQRVDAKVDLINDRLFQQEATLKLVK